MPFWILCLAVPLVVKAEFVLTIFIFGFILGVLAISFNVIFGYAGQLSMFNAAAFGISAYTTFLSMERLHVSFWTGLVIALLLVLALSVVIGAICFKFQLKAFYFALVTMAFAELARLVIMNWGSLTKGTLGILVLQKPTIGFGDNVIKIDGTLEWYYFSLAALFLSAIVCRGIVKSWIGRAFEAIRLNEDLAQTLGIDIFRYKMLAFTIANLLAAVAGALFAFYTGYIEPSYLSTTQSLDVIAMVLIGGAGTVLGPVFGAFILTGLPHVIELSAEVRSIVFGSILILTILLLPRGVGGSLKMLTAPWWTRLRERRAARRTA
jgi:ABC-type branched-chain amino acid transport system, permease component